MAEVVCKADLCSYHSSSGFCTRPYVIMTPGATCSQYYMDSGQPRPQQWDLRRPLETIEEEIEKIEEADN